MSRTVPSVAVLAVCVSFLACKTSRPKDETVVLVDTTPELTTGEESGPAEPEGAPAGPGTARSPFDETLTPVRGGPRVLPPYRGAEPCQMALLGDSPVAKACSERGVRGALELMQTFVRRAKREGFVFQCVDCHVDEDDYMHLRPQADVEFRKLLFLARPEE